MPSRISPSTLRRWRLKLKHIQTGRPLTQSAAAAHYLVSERSWSRWENVGPVPHWLAFRVRTGDRPSWYQ